MYSRDLGEPRDPRQFMMENLEDARAVKAERRAFLRDFRAGRYINTLVLLEPPSCIRTMPLYDFILAIPFQERWMFHAAAQEVGVAPSSTVGGLSRWQRVAMVAFIQDNW